MTSSISQKKILITGAAGFVGSHLYRRLLKEGGEIHLLLRPSSDRRRIADIISNASLHEADLRDAEGIKRIMRAVKPAGIFHLAASPVLSGATASAEELIATNFSGTVNLIQAARECDYEFFINTGSFTEYAITDHPVRESDSCEPMELYSMTKLAGTLFAKALGRTEGRPIVSLRLFTPYGPDLQEGRLLHRLISSALRDQEINLTRPEVSRDYIFIDDAVELYLEAASKAQKYKGEIFNAGSGVRTTIGELADLVLQKTGSRSALKWGVFRQVVYDSDHWQADMTKTFAAFSWRPRVHFKEGLDKTIDWFRARLGK